MAPSVISFCCYLLHAAPVAWLRPQYSSSQFPELFSSGKAIASPLTLLHVFSLLPFRRHLKSLLFS